MCIDLAELNSNKLAVLFRPELPDVSRPIHTGENIGNIGSAILTTVNNAEACNMT